MIHGPDLHAALQAFLTAAYLVTVIVMMLWLRRIANATDVTQRPVSEATRLRLLTASGLWIVVSLSFSTLLKIV